MELKEQMIEFGVLEKVKSYRCRGHLISIEKVEETSRQSECVL